jgi:hypothetical protein
VFRQLSTFSCKSRSLAHVIVGIDEIACASSQGTIMKTEPTNSTSRSSPPSFDSGSTLTDIFLKAVLTVILTVIILKLTGFTF